ncbi:hypothetical protein FGF82_23485 [Salmonella sp. gx-f9]|nr:hypothetical protein [Salmonella sp. gx-f9]
MKVIYEEMVKRGMLTSGKGRRGIENYCEFHEEVGHMIQNCEEFKAMVQALWLTKSYRFLRVVLAKDKYVCWKMNDKEPADQELLFSYRGIMKWGRKPGPRSSSINLFLSLTRMIRGYHGAMTAV